MRIMDKRVKVTRSYQIHLELTAKEISELRTTLDNLLIPSSYLSTRMPPIVGELRDALQEFQQGII